MSTAVRSGLETISPPMLTTSNGPSRTSWKVQPRSGPQAGNPPVGVHQQGEPVRFGGAAIDPRRGHPPRHDPLPDRRRHRQGRGTGPELRSGSGARRQVAALVQLRQHAVGGHGLQLRPGEQRAGGVELAGSGSDGPGPGS